MKKKLSLLTLLVFSLFLTAQEIELEDFASGFSSPVAIKNAGDARLFIVEKAGVIKILNSDATTNPTPFLNIQSQVGNGSETGLLGLAFHPDYATNGFFYVHYSHDDWDNQISRFSVDPNNPNIADPNSELPLLRIDQPDFNHNGGTITFGPDGYLYIGIGDGGGGGDQDNNAQNLNLLLGKMLRIDVDNPSGGNNYGIPADNPFVSNGNARDEIWAYGLRNPFRFSIDDDDNNIWIGDVGQNAVEEVNRASLSDAGLNYGWRCYEGSQTFNTSGCPNMSELTFPIAEYDNFPGASVVGGHVYRGSSYPSLQGVYIFADITGMIGTIDSNDNYIDHGNMNGFWTGFGEDMNSELYVASINGSIKKIIGLDLIGFEEFTANNFTITPNPASQMVRLSVTDDELTSIEVYDLKGSVVYTEENMKVSEKTINVSSFKNGLYIVNATTVNGGNISKKLIIK